jgi:hypothetical protein
MDILLPMHIGAGIVALVASLLAVVSAKGKKLHIRSGRIYFLGMLGIFITAIPMALITGNQFLFITAVFSFYLAFAGIRFARNRSGVPATIDWIAVILMLLWFLALSPCLWVTETTIPIKIRPPRAPRELLAI